MWSSPTPLCIPVFLHTTTVIQLYIPQVPSRAITWLFWCQVFVSEGHPVLLRETGFHSHCLLNKRLHYHLQFTMLCIYIFPTYWSIRSFCGFLLHNSTIEMLSTDTAALHATAGWTSCPTATRIHKAFHKAFSMNSQKGSYAWPV